MWRLQEAGVKTADAVVLRPPIGVSKMEPALRAGCEALRYRHCGAPGPWLHGCLCQPHMPGTVRRRRGPLWQGTESCVRCGLVWQDMERWCAKKPVTARVREADAKVMAGLIQVRSSRFAHMWAGLLMHVPLWGRTAGVGWLCRGWMGADGAWVWDWCRAAQVQDAVLASGRAEPPHVVARFNRFGSYDTAKRCAGRVLFRMNWRARARVLLLMWLASGGAQSVGSWEMAGLLRCGAVPGRALLSCPCMRSYFDTLAKSYQEAQALLKQQQQGVAPAAATAPRPAGGPAGGGATGGAQAGKASAPVAAQVTGGPAGVGPAVAATAAAVPTGRAQQAPAADAAAADATSATWLWPSAWKAKPPGAQAITPAAGGTAVAEAVSPAAKPTDAGKAACPAKPAEVGKPVVAAAAAPQPACKPGPVSAAPAPQPLGAASEAAAPAPRRSFAWAALGRQLAKPPAVASLPDSAAAPASASSVAGAGQGRGGWARRAQPCLKPEPSGAGSALSTVAETAPVAVPASGSAARQRNGGPVAPAPSAGTTGAAATPASAPVQAAPSGRGPAVPSVQSGATGAAAAQPSQTLQSAAAQPSALGSAAAQAQAQVAAAATAAASRRGEGPLAATHAIVAAAPAASVSASTAASTAGVTPAAAPAAPASAAAAPEQGGLASKAAPAQAAATTAGPGASGATPGATSVAPSAQAVASAPPAPAPQRPPSSATASGMALSAEAPSGGQVASAPAAGPAAISVAAAPATSSSGGGAGSAAAPPSAPTSTPVAAGGGTGPAAEASGQAPGPGTAQGSTAVSAPPTKEQAGGGPALPPIALDKRAIIRSPEIFLVRAEPSLRNKRQGCRAP
jgi:hypothetical protein